MAKVLVHYSKITFPYCRPFSYEIDKNGMTWAQPYRDKKGRIKYCCNPNHNHYYGESGCISVVLFFFVIVVLIVWKIVYL